MPIRRGKDINGLFYIWGNHGKRYYYVAGDSRSRERAYNRALKQSHAAYARGYQGS